MMNAGTSLSNFAKRNFLQPQQRDLWKACFNEKRGDTFSDLSGNSQFKA
jgi:hypothetical protein